MGLIDEIDAEQDASRPNRCGVNRVLQTLEGGDRDDLDKALADPGITTAAIHRALVKRGFKIDAKGVAYHRKGTCACAR